MTKVLLVGESWTTSETHFKGFDQFGSVRFHTGADPLLKALKGSPFEVDYMTAHEAARGLSLRNGRAEGL
ncbi:glutamine amidotransferase [Ponticoccus litoralis]|uniref:Glutamine amidotransferase n=1 Tax=Ponticoccus litoralis TaxID=422297 RepID=A0AAW9SL17_9RHOB